MKRKRPTLSEPLEAVSLAWMKSSSLLDRRPCRGITQMTTKTPPMSQAQVPVRDRDDLQRDVGAGTCLFLSFSFECEGCRNSLAREAEARAVGSSPEKKGAVFFYAVNGKWSTTLSGWVAAGGRLVAWAIPKSREEGKWQYAWDAI